MNKQDIINKLIKNIERNNMKGSYVKDKTELLTLLKETIPTNSTIGCGDSITLEDTGVFEFLRNNEYNFLDKYKADITKQAKRKIYLNNFYADYFISGTNALTKEGYIFNIDGNGSRVAPMLYGPNKVILVVGYNKIVDTVDEAIKRSRQIAAPLDAKRLKKTTPCTILDKCIDCKHKERICNDFVLITGQFQKDRIHIIILAGDYGY